MMLIQSSECTCMIICYFVHSSYWTQCLVALAAHTTATIATNHTHVNVLLLLSCTLKAYTSIFTFVYCVCVWHKKKIICIKILELFVYICRFSVLNPLFCSCYQSNTRIKHIHNMVNLFYLYRKYCGVAEMHIKQFI